MDISKKSLVYWLEMLSGKDVLKVNQTRYTEEYEGEFESPIYRSAVDLNTSKLPFVLKRKDTEDESSELVVFHPRTNYENGRASWFTDYQLSNKRFLVNFSKDLFRDSPANSIVQVYYKHEFDNGIPIDQFIYHPTHLESLPIILPYGEFVLVVEDEKRSRHLMMDFTFDLENGLTIKE
jgi:hypothetical protein